MAERTRRGWRRHTWTVVAGAAVIAAAGAGIAVWATAASGAPGYRTAEVTRATVDQALTVTGTAEPVDRATATFQVAGTVASVDVAVGQTVTAGQTLASLDTTTLQRAVSSAQSTLNAKVEQLAEDEAAQAAAANTTTTTTTTTTTPSTTAPTVPPDDGTGTLRQAQQAVVRAQQAADAAVEQAATVLAQAQSACAEPGSGSTRTTPTTSTTTTTTTVPSSSPPSTGTSKGTGTPPTTTTPPSTTATCAAALKAVLTTQQQVSADQKALATAESTLAGVLGTGSSGPGATDGGPSGGTGSSGSADSAPPSSASASSTTTTAPKKAPTSDKTPAASTGSPGSGSTGSGSTRPGSTGSGSTTIPAVQLANDQAAIDNAKASLIEAQQNLAAAQLTTPVAGTVASVGVAVGQTVGADATANAITVISAGSYQVTASLTSSQATEVKVGDRVDVSVNGTTGSLTGTVARVGPVDTSGSSITYPLVVALPPGSDGIRSGASAQATVVVATAKNAVVVPTSAVHTTGAGHASVDVLRTGEEVRKPVSVGIVGSTYTQIDSGLTVGTTVVLADRSEPVPSSNATGTRPGGGLGGLVTRGAGPVVQRVFTVPGR